MGKLPDLSLFELTRIHILKKHPKFLNISKGATKSYYTQYSCGVIVLLNTALCRSAFSTVSLGKTSFLVFLCFLWIRTLKFASSWNVILGCNFVLTLYKKTHFLQTKKLFIEVLQYYVKTCFQICFEFFKTRKRVL